MATQQKTIIMQIPLVYLYAVAPDHGDDHDPPYNPNYVQDSQEAPSRVKLREYWSSQTTSCLLSGQEIFH